MIPHYKKPLTPICPSLSRGRGKWQKNAIAQVYLEVIFGFLVGILLLMAMIRVFQWAGRDMVKRRQANDALLTTSVGSEAAGPLSQIRPQFYYVSDINATFNSAFLGDAFGP